MAYVEVWVDELELDKEQEHALRDLLATVREVANRRWPDDDAVALERAARSVSRLFPLTRNNAAPLFQGDDQYREWRRNQDAEGQRA